MKNKLFTLSSIILISFSIQVSAQVDPIAALIPQVGQVDFFEGSWKELLAHAKETNKPFFVDIYTEWCSPCKLMSKFTFTDSQVADFANANFVAYQIDAEKGEGENIADEYKVKAFPTVLFFDSNGKLLGKAVGYYDHERFLGVMEKYLKKITK